MVALSPGAVLTPRLTEIYGTAEEAEKALKTAYPLGRLGEAEDIAKALCFLPLMQHLLLPAQIS